MIAKIKNFLYDQYSILHYACIGRTINKNQKRKSRFIIYCELMKWYINYGERNKNYAAWNLYQRGANPCEYMGRFELMRIKSKAETQLKIANRLSELDYDVLTKDKFVANSYLAANRIPCVTNEGIVVQGKYYSVVDREDDLASLFEKEKELFFKENSREAGEGLLYVKQTEHGLYVNDKIIDKKSIHALINNGVWVVQKKVQNHEKIRAVNDSALNTTRIVTILDGERPVYLTGFQAFATGGAGIDSWSKGSVYVGIDVENDCLKDTGYLDLKGTSGSVTKLHPDTKVTFEGYHIPYLKEAVALCIKAHRLFYNNFIIGWDIALTENGPLILEANEKPGMNAVQCVDGGMRKRILACYKKLMQNNRDY